MARLIAIINRFHTICIIHYLQRSQIFSCETLCLAFQLELSCCSPCHHLDNFELFVYLLNCTAAILLLIWMIYTTHSLTNGDSVLYTNHKHPISIYIKCLNLCVLHHACIIWTNWICTPGLLCCQILLHNKNRHPRILTCQLRYCEFGSVPSVNRLKGFSHARW